jgi:hypothetical protein
MGMSTASEGLLESFESLSDTDKREVAAEIIRRTRSFNFPPLTDEELSLNAEQVFLDLDAREAADGQSHSG